MIKVKVNWILDNIQIVLMTLKRFKMVADLKIKGTDFIFKFDDFGCWYDE